VDPGGVARLLDGHPEAHLPDALQVHVVHTRHHAGRLGGGRCGERDPGGGEHCQGGEAERHAREAYPGPR
jgi:hypothetical protein